VLIQPSGGGKSRAEELIKKPLMQWERENFIKYQQAMAEYNKFSSPKKGGGGLGLDNFVETPKSTEGIKQTGIKDKILKYLTDDI
jgi:hypothetical protein